LILTAILPPAGDLRPDHVTSQQAIERVVREERLAGKGKLKVKMVLTGEGTRLNHAVEGEIDLSDSAEKPTG
jgi:Family of unknown function (DUF6494)